MFESFTFIDLLCKIYKNREEKEPVAYKIRLKIKENNEQKMHVHESLAVTKKQLLSYISDVDCMCSNAIILNNDLHILTELDKEYLDDIKEEPIKLDISVDDNKGFEDLQNNHEDVYNECDKTSKTDLKDFIYDKDTKTEPSFKLTPEPLCFGNLKMETKSINKDCSDNLSNFKFCIDSLTMFIDLLSEILNDSKLKEIPNICIYSTDPNIKYSTFLLTTEETKGQNKSEVIENFLDELDNYDKDSSVIDVIKHIEIDFEEYLFDIRYSKRKPDISESLKREDDYIYKIKEGFLLENSDPVDYIISKEYTRPTRELPNDNPYSDKLRALVGYERNDSVLDSIIAKNPLIAYCIADGNYNLAYKTYIVSKVVPYFDSIYDNNKHFGKQAIINKANWVVDKKSRKLYVDYRMVKNIYREITRKRKLVKDNNEQYKLQITEKIGNSVCNLNSKSQQVIMYLKEQTRKAYIRQSEDYFIYKNVFGKIMCQDKVINSQDIFIEDRFKTIYLRPLLRLVSKNPDNLKYFDLENNCKNIDISKLMKIAKSVLMKSDYTVKHGYYSEVNLSLNMNYCDIEERLEIVEEVHRHILQITSITDIDKTNPDDNCLIKLPLSTPNEFFIEFLRYV